MRLDGCLTSAPTIVSRAVNQIDVYGRGTGGETFQKHWDLNGWTGWFLLDGTPIGSAAGVVSDHDQREMLFARGASGLMTQGLERIRRLEYLDRTSVRSRSRRRRRRSRRTPIPPRTARPTSRPACAARRPAAGCGSRSRSASPRARRKARVTKIVFFTKGKGRAVRSDRKSPFVVRIKVNRPAGSAGRVYARVYYRRSAKGKLHRKTVSRRYTVCR